MFADLQHYFFVLLYKGYYRLAVIFWDVFCLILQLLLRHFRPLVLLLFRTPLVLRHSLQLRYRPRLLIELRQDILSEWHLAKLHNAGVLLLLLDDAVEHAVVIVHLHVEREDIIDLHLAGPLALPIEVVLQNGEVKDGGAITGLDQHGDVAYVG